MDNNFNNNGGADDDRTVLIPQDQYGNPQVSQPVQPQFNQPMQPAQPMQPQFGQPQHAPQFGQPQFGQPQQAPQFGQPQQAPQFGQPQQAPQFGQPQQMSLNTGNNSNQPKKGKGGTIAIICVCVALVIALIVGLVLILGGGDKDDKKDKKTTEETTEVTTEATEDVTTEAATEEVTEEATTEATTEEATTEASTVETVEGVPLVDVSSMGFTTNDWKSLEFALNGVVYTWPISYAQIKEAGYHVESSIESETLEANYYSYSEWAYNSADETVFMIQFKNFTDTDKTVAESDVLGFVFDSYDFDGTENSIVLCNGVTIGTSYEDVIATMGTPTDEYVSEDSEYGYRTATYDVSDDAYTSSIDFTFMNGVVSEIEIDNYD